MARGRRGHPATSGRRHRSPEPSSRRERSRNRSRDRTQDNSPEPDRSRSTVRRKHSHSSQASSQRSNSPPAWAQQLVESLNSKDAELSQMREEVKTLKSKVDETDETGDRTFKWKGNKKQFKFNHEVREKFAKIVEKAETCGEDSIGSLANEGMSFIDTSNKLICIADRDSWDVVEYFESHPLFSNETEAKRLKTARKEAERVREKKKSQNRTRGRGKPLRPRNSSYGDLSRRVEFNPSLPGGLTVNPSPDKKPNSSFPCFGCGRAGHYPKDCKASSTSTQQK